MSRGQDFVDALRRVGYPRADALSGEDFDWLFEEPEDRTFLTWFCGSVSERNVVSDAELEAFGRLRDAGQPVLEGAALAAALATCPAARLGPRTDGSELARLEDKVRELQRLRNLRLQRRNQRQLMASASGDACLRPRAAEAAATLRRSQGALAAARAQLRGHLRTLSDGAAELAQVLTRDGDGQGPGPRVFPSQLPLESYLGQEERSTAALTAYAKRQLRGPQEPPGPEEARLEMARLQLAFACARQQLAHLRAANLGARARAQRAEEWLRGPASKDLGEGNRDADVSGLTNEVLRLEEQIARVKAKSLPAAVRESARLLSAPAEQADLDLRVAEGDCHSASQGLVLGQLLKQRAAFELLHVAYEVEARTHRDVHRRLESLGQDLRERNTKLRRQLEMLADPSPSPRPSPRSIIDRKDCAARRLYQLLEGENKKKELFITHGKLEEMAKKLKQDVSLVQDQLAASAQEHSFFVSKLNSDVDVLCDALYQGGNHLLLSDQELTEQFHQVESQLNKLNHLFTDILADVKTKRKLLASNKLHQMERELYVYFLKDEAYLKDIVENLEKQSKMKTVGLKD